MRNTFNFISTFAGIGGFDLGLERAGMTCLEQVEKDPSCLQLLEKRFPRAKRHNDIKEYSYHGRKSIDLICGGFPCQDVSIAGRRAGLDGERSGLYFQFERVVTESRPRWFVIENVAGLLSSNGGRDFEIILRGMEELGYCVSWRVFDSQYFGIPQRRRRVFIVGSLGDGSSAQVLFESEGLPGNSPKSGEAGKEDPSGPRGGSPVDRGRIDPKVYNWGSGHSDDLKDEAQTLRADTERNYQIVYEEVSSTLTSHHSRLDLDETYVFTQNSRSEVRGIQGDGQVSGAVTSTAGVQQQNYIASPIVAYKIRDGKEGGGKGYLGSENKSFAITNKDPQRIGLRRFTPLECERLQGFPDGWTEDFSDTTRYEMTGNAVSVPVAEWIGRRIIEIEKLNNKRRGSRSGLPSPI